MTDTLAIRGGKPVREKPFPSWPCFGDREEKRLLDALRSGVWGKMQGTEVKQFERTFAAYHEAKHALGVVNGTVALRINGNVDMSSYAGKGTFELDLKGGPVESLFMAYKESNTMGSITKFKANDKEVRYLDLTPVGRRMEKAFVHVMKE